MAKKIVIEFKYDVGDILYFIERIQMPKDICLECKHIHNYQIKNIISECKVIAYYANYKSNGYRRIVNGTFKEVDSQYQVQRVTSTDHFLKLAYEDELYSTKEEAEKALKKSCQQSF